MISHTPRVLFLGLNNRFSTAVLSHLLTAEVNICGVVLSATGATGLARQEALSPLPLLNPYRDAPLLNIAQANGRPAFVLSAPDDVAALASAAALAPDIGCVACFDRRLPAPWLALPPAGFYNLHPSRLPAYRGPAPLFWTFRDGVTETAVSLHLMDSGLDSGPLAGHATLPLPIGTSEAMADGLAAQVGAALFVENYEGLVAGERRLWSQRDGGEYRPWPQPADFTLEPAWPAERAYHFMLGTADWRQPYHFHWAGEAFALREAVSYASGATLARPQQLPGGLVALPFTPGVLRATTA